MRFLPLLNILCLGALPLGLCSGNAAAATFTVTNRDDSGTGSLRQAVLDANASPGFDTIGFTQLSSYVTLSSSLPEITGEVKVDGLMPNAGDAYVVVRRAYDGPTFPIFTVAQGADVELFNLDISGEVVNPDATFNGGIVRNSGRLVLRDCTLRSSTALNGGAVANETTGELTVTGCLFRHNSAPKGNGGAIFNLGQLAVRSTTLYGNSAQRGGGIYLSTGDEMVGDWVSLENCSIYHNTGEVQGGGLHVANGRLRIDSCTVTRNHSQNKSGVGLFANSVSATRVEVGNSIFVGNAGTSEQDDPATFFDVSSGSSNLTQFVSLGHNIVGRSNSTPPIFSASGDRTGILYDELGFGPSVGRTNAMKPAGNSPVVDAGATDLTADQLGQTRPSGNADDVGAVEIDSAANTAPKMAEPGDLNGRVGIPFEGKLSATDAETDFLTFKIVEGTLPNGLSLNVKTGAISGTPAAISNGTVVKVVASDGRLESEPVSVRFFVAEPFRLVVDNTGSDNAYDGQTTLNEALVAANRSTDFSAITFKLAPGNRTINIFFQQALPLINTPLSIVGPTTGGNVTIQGNYNGVTALSSLLLIQNTQVSIANLTMKDGFAGVGGAISNYYGLVTLDNCLITNNSALFGGGIINIDGSVTARNCTIANNLASSEGGGISTTGGSLDRGITLINCTLTGNSSTQEYHGSPTGGALMVGGGNVVIESCTIVGNQAVEGGGIGVNAGISTSVTLRNSIVAGNIATGGRGGDMYEPLYSTSRFASQGHNLVGDVGNVTTITAPGDKTGVSIADLKLGPLVDNGGPTPTMALLSGSPALDAGETDLATDQRGQARPYGEADDIGAVEAQAGVAVTIQSVTIAPQAPIAGQTLSAQVTGTTSSRGMPTFSYVWKQQRGSKVTSLAETGSMLETAGLDLRRGDVVTVTVIASLGAAQSLPASATVTIANTPIAITELRLQPRAPYVSETLIATVKMADPDKPRPTYSYVWKRNGIVTRTVTDSRNSQDFYNLRQKGHGAKGDVIEVTATASDGESTATASASATIRNSIPVIESLTLSPQAPTPTSTIISTYAGRDADGDKLTRTYKWRIGTKLLKDETGSRLDLKKYSFVKPGDIVSVDLQLFDGEAKSKTLTAKVTVATPGIGTSAAAT